MIKSSKKPVFVLIRLFENTIKNRLKSEGIKFSEEIPESTGIIYKIYLADTFQQTHCFRKIIQIELLSMIKRFKK